MKRVKVYRATIWIVAALGTLGFVASAAFHIVALFGSVPIGSIGFVFMHLGVMLVGVATAGLQVLKFSPTKDVMSPDEMGRFGLTAPEAGQSSTETNRRNRLENAPRWMVGILYMLFAYAAIAFLLGWFKRETIVEEIGKVSARQLVSFSRFWLVFHAAFVTFAVSELRRIKH